jgi:hypothetical protein
VGLWKVMMYMSYNVYFTRMGVFLARTDTYILILGVYDGGG